MSTPASSQPAQAVANAGKCQAADLSFALGAGRQVDQDQWTQVVDMTNKSSSACTMQGFPGVGLIGDTTNQPNDDWALTDSSATGAEVTLQPGATAHFDLAYLNGDLASGGGGENVMSVQRMVITAPDDPNVNSDADVPGNLPWTATVVFQQAATHPGTYVMPVASGS